MDGAAAQPAFVIVSVTPSARAPESLQIRVGAAGSAGTGAASALAAAASAPPRPARGRIVASLSARGVELLGLAPGLAYTPELQERIAGRVVYERARRAAVGWVTRRPLTRAAVGKRLARFALPPTDHAGLLDELESLGLIDDAAYAARAAESRVRREPIAREALADAIARRGVPPPTAAAAARDALHDHDPAADAKALAAKRARTLPPGLSVVAKQRRLFAYLARRGYDEETATAAVEDVVRTD